MVQTISITVSGKVQGVYYRQSAKEKAQELDITGSVQNLANGDVYLIATGTPDQLKQLVEWCRRGPSRARVSEVKVAETAAQEFTGFRITR
jgi:acylphosphatase